ncbi:hypothetical protein RSAG8_00958, partial [Rhizoctonia solani AG-8 WAC10335]
MVLGRLVHYAADVVLVSTVLAGVKKSTGYTPQTNLITEPTLRSVADSVLGLGETTSASYREMQSPVRTSNERVASPAPLK